MKDQSKTKQVLIREMASLRQRIAELERSELDRKNLEDQTERRQTEKELHWAEENFRHSLDDSPLGARIMTIEDQTIYANQAILDIYGYDSIEELETTPVENRYTPESFSECRIRREKRKRSADTLSEYDISIVRKDGEIRHLHVFRKKILWNGEKQFQVLYTDITDRKRAEEKLRESEEYFKEITENSSDIVIIMDKNGAIKYCSRSVERFTGYKPEEIIGRNALKLIHPDDVKRVIGDFGKAILSIDSAIPNAFRIVHKDGSERYFDGLGKNLLDNPIVAGFVMNVRDMTEHKRAEEALRESEEKYRNILENIEDGYFEADLAGNLTFFNSSACRILGYPREEISGMNYRAYMDAENAKKGFRAYNGVYVTGIPQKGFEWEIIRKDGAKRHIEVSISLIVKPGEKPTGFRGIARDVTERKRVEEALQESENRYRELSIIDDLTQLCNSRHFYQQLKMEINRVDRYGHPLTILLLDLDDFKAFNDAYGHIEGDQVLIRLGQVIKRCLRQMDSAYRYGGEEFTILLPMTASADGAVTAERIRTEFKKEIFSPAPGQNVHLTLSLGLAQYKPQEDMKVFVHRVDQLMYQGKKKGKDVVCCES